LCGMTLELASISAEEEENVALQDMTRRFWIALILTIPIIMLVALETLQKGFIEHFPSYHSFALIQAIFATPVVLWAGFPFFERGWKSVILRKLNMFSLIALGIGAAYFYSLVATLFPSIFPASFRGPADRIDLYFEAATVITVLVLLG